MHTTELKPCPFCGSEDIEVGNTHTASFTVECMNCEGQVGGESFQLHLIRPDKFHYHPNPRDKYEATYEDLYPEYQQAFDSAVSKWNTRVALEDVSQLGDGV